MKITIFGAFHTEFPYESFYTEWLNLCASWALWKVCGKFHFKHSNVMRKLSKNSYLNIKLWNVSEFEKASKSKCCLYLVFLSTINIRFYQSTDIWFMLNAWIEASYHWVYHSIYLVNRFIKCVLCLYWRKSLNCEVSILKKDWLKGKGNRRLDRWVCFGE